MMWTQFFGTPARMLRGQCTRELGLGLIAQRACLRHDGVKGHRIAPGR
jgi:hypothetical protein